VRLATFNIYWFGTSRSLVTRSAADDTLVARVIAGLDADVLVLEEICDLARLERVLGEASAIGGRDLRCRVGDAFVTSARADELTDGGAQKVLLAWDARSVAVEAWGPAPVPALRPPLRARVVGSAGAFDVVGVHLKSGRLGAPMTDPDAIRRHAEATALAAFLAEAAGVPTILAGDMNARLGDPSLAPLWALPEWVWAPPEVPADDPWTTFLDRDVIDLIGASSGVPLTTPHAYAWDHDERIAPAGWFRRVDDFVAQRARDFPKAPVENLYRVSDHRPVFVDVG
jgi:endonuclease/exonuclease/phosphatase family metal-dependent hydrolase